MEFYKEEKLQQHGLGGECLQRTDPWFLSLGLMALTGRNTSEALTCKSESDPVGNQCSTQKLLLLTKLCRDFWAFSWVWQHTAAFLWYFKKPLLGSQSKAEHNTLCPWFCLSVGCNSSSSVRFKIVHSRRVKTPVHICLCLDMDRLGTGKMFPGWQTICPLCITYDLLL